MIPTVITEPGSEQQLTGLMGTVVSKAKLKLQGGGEDLADQREYESHGHDHVGVGEDLDINPRHPLPRGIV